ncbi:MAG: GNAT family N-acetyltransferase [Anaerolineae bacterium]
MEPKQPKAATPAITLQPFQTGHIPGLVRLSAEVEAVDRSGFALDRGQLLESIQAAPDDFERRCWLAFAPGDRPVGYIRAEQRANNGQLNYWLHGLVHPGWRRQGLGERLMRRTWQTLQSELAPDRPSYALAWAYKGDEGRQALFAKFGLKPYHLYWEMARQNLADVPPAAWPEGISPRPWDERAAGAVVALRNRIFAEDWDYRPLSAERLCRDFRRGRFEPELAVIAWQGDQPVGFTFSCLAWTRRARRANEGEIVWVGVEPGRRGNGLGAALMQETLRRLHAAGAEVATLGADTTRDEAPRLYTRLGFAPRKVVVDYRRQITREV